MSYQPSAECRAIPVLKKEKHHRVILEKIIAKKKEEIEKAKKTMPSGNLKEILKDLPEAMDFKGALSKEIGGGNRIIAEVKKASPSRGVIREEFNPVEIAREYEKHGAVAVSVLTDNNFFMGSLEYLREIKKNISIPVFRKDFLLDPYQIYESKAWGADAVLLIAAILDEVLLKDFLKLLREVSLFSMVEVHSKKELQMALDAGSEIIGINNRDLRTFKTDLKTTHDLIKHIPEGTIVVSESGIENPGDVTMLKQSGVDACLIGESLMRAENPGQKLSEFVGGFQH